ncbi:glycosyltransferase [Klebsiella pneumoniae]|nr:glycosyltransferase [Klebsiella pneumoniae]
MTKSISIYIPTYNRPEMLDRALNSLKKQTYKNFQVLVCNDGSVRDYEPVIHKYQHCFDDFKYIKNDFSKGACFSRNALINIADGEYITGLDDDDEFLPDRLQQFIFSPYLNKYSYLCAGHFTKSSSGIFKQKISEGVVHLDTLLSKNVVGNQIFTETSHLIKSGGFDICLPAWQDYDAWITLSKMFGDGYRLEKYTYQWNIDHEEGRISNSSKARLGYELFIEKHHDLLTRKNLRHLMLQDIINRNERLTTADIRSCISLDTIPVMLKYKVKSLFPGLKEKIYKVKN